MSLNSILFHSSIDIQALSQVSMFSTWFSQCSWQILVLTLVTIVHWLVTSDFMISLYTPVLHEQIMKLIQFYQHGDGTNLILGYITRILGRLCRRYHSQYLVIVVLWVVIILLIRMLLITIILYIMCREYAEKELQRQRTTVIIRILFS